MTLKIAHELYVAPPLMGHAQAVSVEPLNGKLQDILCGTKIIKNPVEGIGAKHSRIVELVGSIRTQTRYWNSPYRLMTSQVSML
jgi:hypothetical protein